MAQEIPPREHDHGPRGDPWSAFGYLVSGVFVYGLIGWLLDRWLGTTFLVAVGILLGAVLGTYQTWARFRIPQDDSPTSSTDEKSQ